MQKMPFPREWEFVFLYKSPSFLRLFIGKTECFLDPVNIKSKKDQNELQRPTFYLISIENKFPENKIISRNFKTISAVNNLLMLGSLCETGYIMKILVFYPNPEGSQEVFKLHTL